MNIKYFLVLLLVLGLIGGAAYFSYQPLGEAIRFGLDIEGGIMVLLEAVPSEQVLTINDEAMVRAMAILRQRVDGLGVAEPELVREGARRIRVSLPGFGDQQEVLNVIGKTALLEFRDMEGKVFLSGDRLRDAQERLGERNQPYVTLTLDEEGGRLMREYTSANIGRRLIITMDGEVLSAPIIEGAVGSEGSITGLGSLAEARSLAIMLRSGALPVALEIRDFRGVGPTLGQVSLDRSVQAGIIGLILVVLFMLAVYRSFGLAANIALAVYALLLMWSLAAINATLTLPGIAGIILGLGMAVDANVIIFERIKDELKDGRSIRVATNYGFKRALWTVMDANLTTLIATGVLYWFGTGPVRGFAVTLSLSVVISIVSAIFITRFLINLMLNSKIVASAKALGL